MKKEEILQNIKNCFEEEKINRLRNSMGVSESYYNAYYLVGMCFTNDKEQTVDEYPEEIYERTSCISVHSYKTFRNMPISEEMISLNLLDPTLVDDLTQELLAVKLKDVDKDNKVAVQSKDEMKKMLGRSPDLSDALMMRMLVEIKSNKTTGRYAIATMR
jgi:hypothetical protein